MPHSRLSTTIEEEQITEGYEVSVKAFYLQGTEAELDPEGFENFLMRIKCLSLLARIPDEGIPELYETMNEIYEFYDTRIQDNTPLLPQVQKIQAIWGKSITRPEFPIVEDEE